MLIKNIQSRNFRNLEDLTLELGAGVNIFIGDNGQGKTNFLELIYFLCRGETFRYAKTENLINNEVKSGHSDFANSKGQMNLVSRDLDYELEYSISGNSKNFVMNGKRATLSQLRKLMSCVHFSPESLSAIKSGPDERRKLVDDLLMTHDFVNIEIMREFKKALKSRNKVLKNYKQGLVDLAETEAILGSLDSVYLTFALKLTMARISALKDIQPDLEEAMAFILGDEKVNISVDYVISSKPALDLNFEEVRYLLESRLKQLKTSELALGVSLVGPQKHDIRFLFNGEDSRYFCSQGQQRAMILSFKMAQIVYHYRIHREFPLLLLDDVLSELDPKKRSNLVTFLKGISSQIIMTTTDLEFQKGFDENNLSVFSLSCGSILNQ